MQPAARALPPQPQQVKIYNAVYSSVQVYECMVRGIAVMRRRADSYVNATQILKVAGVDKGRRTKILEKEILPGKHEIVQGGYGKYQGTWIPLERGRDIALQYGVSHLLSPLFDFVPSQSTLGGLPPNMTNVGGTASPYYAPALYASYVPGYPANYLPSALPSAPIMPGSALRLLNQGRAQGLFTPSTSLNQGIHYAPASYPGSPAPNAPGVSPTPPPAHQLKRTRSDMEGEAPGQHDTLHTLLSSQASGSHLSALAASPDIRVSDVARPSSAAPALHGNGAENPSPSKRARTEPPLAGQVAGLPHQHPSSQARPPSQAGSRRGTATPQPVNGLARADSVDINAQANGAHDTGDHKTRFASKPFVPRHMDPSAPLKDHRRATITTTIVQRDDPNAVLDFLREIPPDPPGSPPNVDIVLDELGHTALHIAASLGRLKIVEALIASGADIHRGNYNGETPLIRAGLLTNNFDQQSFGDLVALLHSSIRTLDTARKSVLHHVVALAGVRNRAIVAFYYLEQVLLWIAKKQDGDFKSIVDLQDEHGDTSLNIAARVGNRSLVRSLLDVGANRILPNKLGLRPGDFGVENEELGGGPRVEDIIASLRAGPSAPIQKSQDVIADMTSIIQGLSAEFSAEVKVKQDSLDVTQAHLRAATRELSEQRKQIQIWQAKCAEYDQVNQRIRNLERALVDEDKFDWTGRTELDGSDARTTAGPGFAWRGQASTMSGLGGLVDVSFNLDAEPTIPMSDSPASLIRLRRLKTWHVRMEKLVEERLKNLQGASAEREFQCKKIVALCTGVPIDKVEEMLDDLVIAVESETQIVDIGRVSGFMQKVRDGVI
ncbi:apses-domain-containing protein [Auriscalpium vulgare]|uniref:Apses-domain-containing protein n=1 Tax=Auriscalpium vulgare TaxID=40419 RepID=A0ACB8S352_9AGAM|nr:apses-domain-containing protein [Auriscalpium vulgare]